MKTSHQTSKPRFLGKKTLIAVAAVFLFGCAQNALAQPWTSDTNNNNVFKTSTTGSVGIGTQTPTGQLHIGGSLSAIDVSDGAASIFRINTNVTAPAGYDIYALKFSPTFTKAGSGTHSYFVGVNIQPPTISGSGASITNAVSLFVGGAPSGATNNYAFWVGGGSARFDGNVGIGTTSPSFRLQANTPVGGQVEQMTPGSPSGTFAVINQSNVHGLYFGIGSSGNAWLQVARHDGSPATYNLILQSAGGNVGIGTTAPGQRLSVAGTVESTSGGFKFPDGTVQNTAAVGGGGGGGTITGVNAGAGLTGGGSSGSVTLDIGAGTGLSVGADS